jgi:hypothetical protein
MHLKIGSWVRLKAEIFTKPKQLKKTNAGFITNTSLGEEEPA